MRFKYDEEIIRLFADKDLKEGLLFKLARPHRLGEVKSAITHKVSFDQRCMTELPKKPTLEEVYSLLKARGAGEGAYIFSNAEEMHGRIIPLGEAIELVLGWATGTLIYCVEGHVGYYEPDGWKGYFIIHRMGE